MVSKAPPPPPLNLSGDTNEVKLQKLPDILRKKRDPYGLMRDVKVADIGILAQNLREVPNDHTGFVKLINAANDIAEEEKVVRGSVKKQTRVDPISNVSRMSQQSKQRKSHNAGEGLCTVPKLVVRKSRKSRNGDGDDGHLNGWDVQGLFLFVFFDVVVFCLAVEIACRYRLCL